MKALYLECNMGAAGDMLMSALSELIPDKTEFIRRINALGIPKVSVSAESVSKCGINGTHFSVKVDGAEETSEDVHSHEHLSVDENLSVDEHTHEHEHVHTHEHTHAHGHHHSSLSDIEGIITRLDVSEKVKTDALAVYRLIAEAESHAHGNPVGEIHFHEVGTMDAVADIVGVCMLMEKIAPDKVICSPVHVGSGQVRCAHGILPVPAPATAHILRGVPIYGGRIEGELCTPTGAALLKHFASEFGEMPIMTLSAVGYGMGTKEFSQANCVRAMLGELDGERGEVCEICCNLDDMTPEEVSFAAERLFEGGSLDVYTVPIGMKKSRSAVMLVCLCPPDKRGEIIRLIFRHTSTIGIREKLCQRHTLKRSERVAKTKFGAVRVKVSEGFGVKREKAEFEDMAQIAKSNNLTLEDAKRLI